MTNKPNSAAVDEALKPCPFCGDDDCMASADCDNLESGMVQFYQVECGNCTAYVIDCTEKGAIEKWNTRTTPSQQPVDCTICSGKGWFSDADYHTGEEVQVQCEPCLGTGKTPKRESGDESHATVDEL